jgi:hypothetical protein
MFKKILVVVICVIALFAALKLVNFEKQVDNAYVVSSEWESAPIISSETGQTVGQAYQGFAVSITDTKDGKAYFDVNIANSEELVYIPVEYMESAFVDNQSPSAMLSFDMIYTNPGVDISILKNEDRHVIARFIDSTGPIQPVIILDDGYIFLLGMNWVYVSQSDVIHLIIDFGAA